MNDTKVDIPVEQVKGTLTNDIKKGMWVILRNGWKAEMWDNMRGTTRVCDVHGWEHEAGSVYCHDMLYWGHTKDTINNLIEHTKKQLELKIKVEEMGM